MIPTSLTDQVAVDAHPQVDEVLVARQKDLLEDTQDEVVDEGQNLVLVQDLAVRRDADEPD